MQVQIFLKTFFLCVSLLNVCLLNAFNAGFRLVITSLQSLPFTVLHMIESYLAQNQKG